MAQATRELLFVSVDSRSSFSSVQDETYSHPHVSFTGDELRPLQTHGDLCMRILPLQYAITYSVLGLLDSALSRRRNVK